MPPAATRPVRARRLRLYGPFAALLLLAIVWSIAWLVIRGRVVSGLDDWMAAEGAAGRRWSCADRDVGGYPFRIEIRCSTLSLERPDLAATLRQLVVVAQVYNPGHIIAEAAGPLRVQAGPTVVDAAWRALQASIVTTVGAQRLALVADEARVKAASPEIGSLDVPGRRFEMHVRPDPVEPTSADLAFSALGTGLPALDSLVGGTEPSDLDLVTTVTRAYDLPARPLWGELERWRLAGGQVRVARLAMTKGQRRFEATGEIAIDEAHRPVGRLEGSAVEIEGLLGRFVGDKAGLASGLLGALLGGSAPPPAAVPPRDPNGRPLRPLPPVRVEAGRLYLGPLAVPGVRIPALY